MADDDYTRMKGVRLSRFRGELPLVTVFSALLVGGACRSKKYKEQIEPPTDTIASAEERAEEAKRKDGAYDVYLRRLPELPAGFTEHEVLAASIRDDLDARSDLPRASLQKALVQLASADSPGQKAQALWWIAACFVALGNQGYRSLVTFSTSNPEARVELESKRFGERLSIPEPTVTSPQPVPVGFWYVWPERNGQASGPRKLYKILRAEFSIVLEEHE